MTAMAVDHILSGDLRLLEDRLSQHPQVLQLKRLLARSLFNKIFFSPKQPTRLDPRFTPALEKLQQDFEEFCLSDLHFFSTATHPLRKLFDTLQKFGCSWYARDSKASQIFFDKILELIDAAAEWARTAQLNANDKTNNTKLLKLLADFIHWINAESKRAGFLEERLCESELSQISLLAAENYATESINTAFDQAYLPTDLCMRLNSHLKNCLQHAYLKENQNEQPPQPSPFLRKWQQLFPLLGNIFHAYKKGDAAQDLYRDIPIAINELELSIPLAAGAKETYSEFVALVTQRLMQIVQHQAVETFRFTPLDKPQELSFTQPNSFVQKNIDSLKTGQWFLVMGEHNNWIRCKLALINSTAHCLLFVDNSGRKVMLKSFADFSSLSALGDARPIAEMSIEKAIRDTLTQLITKIESQNAEIAETDAFALEHTKKLSAEKALAEAAALELQTKQHLNEATLNVSENESQNRASETMRQAEEISNTDASTAASSNSSPIASESSPVESLASDICLQQIQALGLGAWVEIIYPTKSPQRLKLAVVIAAAGKFIFVDELGRKQGEFLREQLVELMQQHQFKIISQGEKFEDQLVKVIRGLRKDIS